MLFALQTTFSVLLLACVALFAYRLFQLYRFDAGSQIARLSGIVTILGGLFAFLLAVMGFIEDDPKSFLALFGPDVFSNSNLLLILCSLLACVLAITIYSIFRSRKIEFVLRGLRLDEDDILHFTLTSPGSTVLRVQNLYLNVLDVSPLSRSTFPYYGEGAITPPRIRGSVHLQAKRARYQVETEGNVESNLGGGKDPSDFSVKVSSDPGIRYRVRLEVDWFAVFRPKRVGKYSFEDQEIQIESPLRWETFVHGNRRLKILFYRYVENLVHLLRSLDPAPSYTILVADNKMYGITPEQINEFDNVAYVPESADESITELVGRIDDEPYSHYYRPHNFLLIDGQVLLLQGHALEQAEIIEDKDFIAAIDKAYDTIAAQFIG
jgi:hypothetical protein